jgi:hypothetical protein
MKTEAPLIDDAPQGSDDAHQGSDDAHQGSDDAHQGSDDAPQSSGIQEQDLQPQERFEDELIMNLERDQFVAETSRPVPRAALSAHAIAGLWVLRVFVVLVSLMVIYTFIDQLH